VAIVHGMTGQPLLEDHGTANGFKDAVKKHKV
jgi:hypothetical protein